MGVGGGGSWGSENVAYTSAAHEQTPENYRKTPKSSDTQQFAVTTLKFEQGCFTIHAE